MNRKKNKIHKEIITQKIRQTNELWSLSSTAHDHADEFCEKKKKRNKTKLVSNLQQKGDRPQLQHAAYEKKMLF